MSTEGKKPSVANTDLDAFLATVFVQLHTGHPGAAGTSNIATNATRQGATMASASGGSKANSADVVWSNVSTTETYLFFTVWDASSAGNFLVSGAVTGGAVTAGNDFKIPSGSLTVSETVAS